MALSRKFLTALGIEADKVDEIIQAHSETVEGLKNERDSYKADAEKYKATKEELDKANEQLKDLNKEDSYKVKYETEKTNASKAAAYKSLLKEIGISDKRIDAVARLAELDKIKLDKDGKIEGVDDLKKSLSDEWADFIVKDGSKGAETSTPPDGQGGTVKTKKEIMEIKDTTERQKAWAEYLTQGGK